mgnify:CR=1 FL=1
MEFQKNKFYNSKPTKIAGNKVLPKNNPFEISKQFLNKMNKIEAKPITPERRLEEQQNQNHFIHKSPFQK